MLGATLYLILDTLLARIIRIILESFLIRAGMEDPSLPRSLSLESWILDPGLNQKRFQNDSDDSGKVNNKFGSLQGGPESSESFWNHF